MLDASQLDAIAQEARMCFLYDDAPDYQQQLEAGLTALYNGEDVASALHDLMKTAHSLKGGAGIAQLSDLSDLAHKLEDLLEALYHQQVTDTDRAYDLLCQGVTEVTALVNQSLREESPQTEVSSDLLSAIADFLANLPQATIPEETEQYSTAEAHSSESEGETTQETTSSSFVQSVLEVDLEECLERVEPLLQEPTDELIPALEGFCEECTLLAETLSLDWLQQDIQPLQTALTEDQDNIATKAETIFKTLREHRQQYLNPEASTESASASAEATTETGANHTNPDPGLSLKMPVTRLDRISNTFGELIINYERLNLISEQLQEANRSLHKHSFQLSPIKEQVQTFYDQLATNINTLNYSSHNEEFDPLQLDQYSNFHSTLQDFQELMVRVQENRADIDIIARDFQDSLENLRSFLNTLRTDITNSRLIPFGTYAQRFSVPLQNLNERYHKSVQLVLEGEDTLVDQVILEQLQTPLTHLFRNAFDHGIEPTEERVAVDKSPIATISFSARLQGNRILIEIRDDGRGINLEKIFEKAKSQGLTQAKTSQELTRDQILEFLFLSNFSTAKTVSDLSGRGVGLDVVRMQVERLNGTVSIDSTLGKGTQFSLSIPLTLSILPFLLCRVQQQTLAIPASKILGVVSLKEMSEEGTLFWHQQTLPVYPLLQLLPYPEPIPPSGEEPIGLVLNIDEKLIVVGIDGLQGERELVVKPFDRTIPVPPYVAGCTVLGTGEVVPVVDPDYWGELLSSIPTASASETIAFQENLANAKEPTILVIDDSVAVRRNLERLLTESGYQVIACRDGKEATTVLDQPGEEITVVICDIEMPRLDGFGVLQTIRSHSQWHYLPVIMLTSRGHEQHRQKAFSLGANDYLGKPFNPRNLLATIQNYAMDNQGN